MEQRIVQMSDGSDATGHLGRADGSGLSLEVPGSRRKGTLIGPQGAPVQE